METSMISGKAISLMQKDQKDMNSTFFEVNQVNSSSLNLNKTSKPRYETPDRAKDTYEHIFLKRLQFLKSLLSEDGKLNSGEANNNTLNLFNNKNLTENNNNISQTPRHGKTGRLDISQ